MSAMQDLWFGIAINLAVSGACGYWLRQVSRGWPLRFVDVAAVTLGIALVSYIVFAWNRPWLANWLPSSNLIVLGNGLPLFVALLMGLTCRRLRGRPRSRTTAVILLTFTGLGALIRPLLGQAPVCEERWEGEICLQTTPHTCSAASAATILRRAGVFTSEGEMARLCLTRQGTHWAGLFRGLTKKRPDGWRIDVLQAATPDRLRSVSRDEPAILTVELPRDLPAAWAYRQESGWVPGVSHSVVCFGPDGKNHWQIADPANGFEIWTTADLLMLWQGEGFWLTRK
jgi:hypothetical protein